MGIKGKERHFRAFKKIDLNKVAELLLMIPIVWVGSF